MVNRAPLHLREQERWGEVLHLKLYQLFSGLWSMERSGWGTLTQTSCLASLHPSLLSCD